MPPLRVNHLPYSSTPVIICSFHHIPCIGVETYLLWIGPLWWADNLCLHGILLATTGQQVFDNIHRECCILNLEVKMPFVRMQVRHAKTLSPDPELGIGARLRAIANQIREVAQEGRTLGSSLDATWEGNAQEMFSEYYRPEMGNTDACTEHLENLANRIEAISVTIWETSWEEVWVPERSGDWG